MGSINSPQQKLNQHNKTKSKKQSKTNQLQLKQIHHNKIKFVTDLKCS